MQSGSEEPQGFEGRQQKNPNPNAQQKRRQRDLRRKRAGETVRKDRRLGQEATEKSEKASGRQPGS